MSIPKIADYPLPSAADLPANVATWVPNPRRGALLIHDMQRYFVAKFAPDSNMVRSIVQRIRSLREACRTCGVPVIYSAQPADQTADQRGLLSDVWGPGLTGDTEGAAIIDELSPRAGEVVLTKWRYSAFQRTDLEKRLRELGRDELYVCGVYTHIGCLMTAGDAFMRDIKAFVVADATADFDRSEHVQALRYVARRCGAVLDSAALQAKLVPTRSDRAHAVQRDLAAILEVPLAQVGLPIRIDDLGLDSIRLMSLVEAWTAGLDDVDFTAFATCETVDDLVCTVVSLERSREEAWA